MFNITPFSCFFFDFCAHVHRRHVRESKNSQSFLCKRFRVRDDFCQDMEQKEEERANANAAAAANASGSAGGGSSASSSSSSSSSSSASAGVSGVTKSASQHTEALKKAKLMQDQQVR